MPRLQSRNAFANPGRQAPDAHLERALRRIVLAGALLVLALPAARGASAWFGALPLWLLAMPLSSWWALHHFRLPRLQPRPGTNAATRKRRGHAAQARRRRVPVARGGVANAA
ncbi:hypothetical protein MQC88_09220 [Luteimonas sp. 50]|uniref:Transmembrane protein n=1 Tax=Cognatiluteimonas sedimenti TaxID=2927791 RepID=A0ABT0A575_9GAMM|nr:hypothetical protein [Lysobacter sedimenti]MCJ0826126.1 hypothetical protein [Lysobacter sedimenti]